MGNCCVRELPSTTPDEGKEVLETAFSSPIATSSEAVNTNSLQTAKKTYPGRGLKIAEFSRRPTLVKSFTKQFSWEQDLAAISVPAKRLSPLFEEMYELRIESRRGLLGAVTVGTHKPTQIKRVVGKVERLGRADEDVTADLEALTSLSHPVLLRAETFLYNRKEVCLLSENFTGVKILDFAQIAEKQSEALVKSFAFQLLRLVVYMQFRSKGLKPLSLPQFLFYQYPSKEISFKYLGLAEWKLPSTHKSSLETSRLYTAPEGTAGDSEKAVIWSCAVLLCILLTNTLPSQGSTTDFNLTGKVWTRFDSRVKSLISAMLAKDPRKRPTALECLAHPWLQDCGLAVPAALSTVMTHLRKFQGGDPLKLAALSFIAMNLLTPEEKQPFADIFAYLNTSGNGEISLEELTSAFSKVSRAELSESLAADVFRAVDINRRGSISFAEFLLASIDSQSLTKSKHLKAAFDLQEPDSNGQIALEDLKIMLRSRGEEGIWQKEEGKMGLKEFVRFMREVLGEGRR